MKAESKGARAAAVVTDNGPVDGALRRELSDLETESNKPVAARVRRVVRKGRGL
jgi:hypothetical protein